MEVQIPIKSGLLRAVPTLLGLYPHSKEFSRQSNLEKVNLGQLNITAEFSVKIQRQTRPFLSTFLASRQHTKTLTEINIP